MDLPEQEPITIKIGDREVVVDTNRLIFTEATLNEYMQKMYAWYDYFGRALAEAEALLNARKAEYDRLVDTKFDSAKSAGNCSDKLAQARSESDPAVVEARLRVVAAQRKVKLLMQHLRAWDKAHDCALNLAFNLRKEMDKLNFHVKEKRIEEVLKGEQ